MTNKKRAETFICNVKTIEDYYSLCCVLSQSEWIYRGHANENWRLKTSLERVIDNKKNYLKKIKKDHPSLAEMIKRHDSVKEMFKYIKNGVELNRLKTPMEFLRKEEYYAIKAYKELSHHDYEIYEKIKLLCDIQHFEGKTRLLDFTKSIIVALYFAFENKYSTDTRCIWAINYKALKDNLIYPQKCFYAYNGVQTTEIDDYININKEKMIKIKEYIDDNNKEIREINKIDKKLNKIKNNIENKYFKGRDVVSMYARYLMSPYLNEILLQEANRSIESQEDDLSGIVDEIIPLEMPGVNPRIDAQNGLFLFPIKFMPIEDSLCTNLIIKKDTINNPLELNNQKDFKKYAEKLRWASIIKIKFDYTFSEYSRQIFENSNTNAKNIFPDETGIAQSIEYW